jgi:hypothetical protein
VVTRKDPLTDIESLADNENIQLVLKDGVVIKDLSPAGVAEMEPAS